MLRNSPFRFHGDLTTDANFGTQSTLFLDKTQRTTRETSLALICPQEMTHERRSDSDINPNHQIHHPRTHAREDGEQTGYHNHNQSSQRVRLGTASTPAPF
jgi:hypothetical protein